jgi:CBS domain-containing protein
MSASPVSGIMKQSFVAAEPDEPIDEVRQTLRLARMRHLVVTRGGYLVGIVSYREILESLLASRSGGARGAPRPVGEVMKPAPAFVSPETSLADAADRMCRYGIGCLPVVAAPGNPREAGSVVGLITESDLLRAAYLPRGA